MVINSFLGSVTNSSSSAFTIRISDSLLTIGVSVVFKLRSYWQSHSALHHSSNTSFSIRPLSACSPASTSGFTIRTWVENSWNTLRTGGFK